MRASFILLGPLLNTFGRVIISNPAGTGSAAGP